MFCCCELGKTEKERENENQEKEKKGGEFEIEKRNLVLQCGVCTPKNCGILDIHLYFLVCLLLMVPFYLEQHP